MAGWNDAILDEMRRLGDPAADRAVQAVFEAGQLGKVNALLSHLVRNDQWPGAAEFPELQQFLVDSASLPAWADPALIGAGEQLFLEWGFASLSVLSCASLPECYVLGDVATVLGRTGELKDHVTRRIPETVMMVLAVMEQGGLAAGGSGIRLTQRVRLMHAAVRHLLLQPPPAAAPRAATLGDIYHAFLWKPEFGTPISQQDLAIVILTFSHVVLRGWRDLGIAVSPDQARAYLHCWNVVGHVLGIEDRLLVREPEDAGALFEAIKQRRGADTRDGRNLTRALLEYCESFAPQPRGLFRPVPRILMNTLLTRDTCARLGVPRLTWMEQLQRLLFLTLVWTVNLFGGATFRAVPGSGGIAALFAGAIIGELVERNRGGNRPPFQIPDGLGARWRIARSE